MPPNTPTPPSSGPAKKAFDAAGKIASGAMKGVEGTASAAKGAVNTASSIAGGVSKTVDSVANVAGKGADAAKAVSGAISETASAGKEAVSTAASETAEGLSKSKNDLLDAARSLKDDLRDNLVGSGEVGTEVSNFAGGYAELGGHVLDGTFGAAGKLLTLHPIDAMNKVTENLGGGIRDFVRLGFFPSRATVAAANLTKDAALYPVEQVGEAAKFLAKSPLKLASLISQGFTKLTQVPAAAVNKAAGAAGMA